MIEVRKLKTLHTHTSPFTGEGIVIVLEKTPKDVHLFYPFDLTDWWMPYDEVWKDAELKQEGYLQCEVENGQLWPVNQTGGRFDQLVLSNAIRQKATQSKMFQRSLTQATVENVCSVIAFLESKAVDAVRAELEGNVQTRESKKSDGPPKEKVVKAPKVEKKFKFIGDATQLKGRFRLFAEAMLALGEATQAQILEQVLKGSELPDNWGAGKKEPKAGVVYFTNRWADPPEGEPKLADVVS